jgi:hypothetical protein
MRALYQIRSKLLRLKWQLAALRFERALRRHALALKYGRADQLRDERGRWADEGGGIGGGSRRYEPEMEPLAASKPDGHHFVPRSLYRDLPLSQETRKILDEAKTGPLNGRTHGWSREHAEYNSAVREKLDNFMKENGIAPEQMTPDQARSFVDQIKRSVDPRIRGLNMRLYMREIQYWLRRAPGRNE